MRGISDSQPSEQQKAKPPRRHWKATESFFDLKLSHWVEIALTAALVGIGIGQLVIYSRQANIMDTQANIANDQNKITASIQRSFITVSSFETPVRFGSGFAQQTKYWWFVPTIKNSGNTPTKNMKFFITATCPTELDIGLGAYLGLDCDFTRPPGPLDPEDILNMAVFKGKERRGLLGPQSAMSLSGVGITEKSMGDVEKGFPIFISGIIYYNDIFPRSQLHVTKFCYQITASHSDKNEIVSGYDFCKHWNCADDECKTDREIYNAEITNLATKPPP
jgi:hypothetical protein